MALPMDNDIKMAKGGSANLYLMLAALLIIALSSISVYCVVIVFFGMLPGMIACIIDQEPKRYISKIVLSFNSIGVLPHLISLIKGQTSGQMSFETIIDPMNWFMMYGAAALGWTVYWLFPQCAVFLSRIRNSSRKNEILSELDELSREWGESIKKLD